MENEKHTHISNGRVAEQLIWAPISVRSIDRADNMEISKGHTHTATYSLINAVYRTRKVFKSVGLLRHLEVSWREWLRIKVVVTNNLLAVTAVSKQ